MPDSDGRGDDVAEALARANLGGGSGGAAGGANPGANANAFNFNLGAAAAAGDSDDGRDDDSDDDDDDDDDLMQILPPQVVRRVERLRDINTEREAIVAEYQKERAALERRFAARYAPLYGARADVIAGKMDGEIDAEAEAEAEGGDGDGDGDGDGNGGSGVERGTAGPEGGEEIVGIPQFWVCAMGHMQAVAELVTETDVDCLESLTDVRCTDDEDGEGFTLEFHFAPNDYFSNKVLTKKYTIPNLLLDDEPILKDVDGCDIDWKAGMCLTHREVKKKQRAKAGKNAGKIRTVVRKERQDSFFHFFIPPKIPSMDQMDEEEADAVEQAFDMDYDVAQAFRSHIVPKAALWFTGEALDEGFDMPEGMEWPGEEGAGEGGAPAAAAGGEGGGARGPFPPPVAGEENPECQQS